MIATIDYSDSKDIHTTRPNVVLDQFVGFRADEVIVDDFGEIETSSIDELEIVSDGNSKSTEKPSVRVYEGVGEWTRFDEDRFYELATLHAQGKINDQEKEEFADLQGKRRVGRIPRSIDDIMFEYKRDILLRQLEESLRAYVKFIRT